MKRFKMPSGRSLPALGLGTWKMDDQVVEQAVYDAINIGFRHIDCAWIYLNETGVGKGLKRAFAEGLVDREAMWVTSKLWNDCHRTRHVKPALEKTLADLQLGYLDLYLIHWPVAHQNGVARPEKPADYESLIDVPIIETWQAMEACVEAGLCRNIGVSNFSQLKLESLLGSAKIKPVVNQVELHPLLQQNQLKSFCDSNEILLTAYSPLGSGDRPDTMKKGDEPNLFAIPEVQEVADEHQVAPAQILIAWAISRGTAAIPKSASKVHLQQNLAAAKITLSESQMSKLAKLDQHYRFVDGAFWEMEGGPYSVANLWDE